MLRARTGQGDRAWECDETRIDCAVSHRECAAGTKRQYVGTGPDEGEQECAASRRECATGTKKSRTRAQSPMIEIPVERWPAREAGSSRN